MKINDIVYCPNVELFLQWCLSYRERYSETEEKSTLTLQFTSLNSLSYLSTLIHNLFTYFFLLPCFSFKTFIVYLLVQSRLNINIFCIYHSKKYTEEGKKMILMFIIIIIITTASHDTHHHHHFSISYTNKIIISYYVPTSAAFFVRERIRKPILPYKIIITAIGIAKNMHVDTSHK